MYAAEISLFKNGVEFLKSFSLGFVLFSGELCLQPLMHAFSCFVEIFPDKCRNIGFGCPYFLCWPSQKNGRISECESKLLYISMRFIGR